MERKIGNNFQVRKGKRVKKNNQPKKAFFKMVMVQLVAVNEVTIYAFEYCDVAFSYHFFN